MSAIVLCFPAIFVVVSGEALEACMQSPSSWRSQAAGMDVDVCSFCAQLTAGVVTVDCQLSRQRYQMTIAVSSKSLMVSLPFGFPSDTSSVLMSNGNDSCHTTWGMSAVPSVHMPPIQ
eukprot:15005846-Ditylum_brightwellii.AAC.1